MNNLHCLKNWHSESFIREHPATTNNACLTSLTLCYAASATTDCNGSTNHASDLMPAVKEGGHNTADKITVS